MRTADDAEVVNRVRAELRANGWCVLEVDGTDRSTNSESLGHLASGLGATAAVRVFARIGQIDLFIARSWGNIDETLRSGQGPFDGQVLALRTTEALRARGLELDSASADSADRAGLTPPRAVPPSPDSNARPRADATGKSKIAKARDVEPAAPRHNSRLPPSHGIWLDAASAIVASPGGLGISVAAAVDLRLQLSETLSVVATGVLPMNSQRVSGSAGQANVATNLVGLSTELTWLRHSIAVETVGLGAAALVTVMRGTRAGPGYVSETDVVLTAGPYSYLRTSVVLGRGWRLFGLVMGGASIPEVQVTFDRTVVGTWGQPFGVLALGAGWRSAAW